MVLMILPVVPVIIVGICRVVSGLPRAGASMPLLAAGSLSAKGDSVVHASPFICIGLFPPSGHHYHLESKISSLIFWEEVLGDGHSRIQKKVLYVVLEYVNAESSPSDRDKIFPISLYANFCWRHGHEWNLSNGYLRKLFHSLQLHRQANWKIVLSASLKVARKVVEKFSWLPAATISTGYFTRWPKMSPTLCYETTRNNSTFYSWRCTILCMPQLNLIAISTAWNITQRFPPGA